MLTFISFQAIASNFKSNANLNSLTISAGTLSPTFASNTYSYSVVENSSTNSITVTPTQSASGSTIMVTVNSGTATTVASGSASGALSLTTGTNTITITVSKTNYNTETYTLTVTKENISYANSPFIFYNGTAITPQSATASDSPTSYSISPAISAGLSFSTSTGQISGTPSATTNATNYTITANYANSITATVVISITVLAPTISYNGSPFTFIAGNSISSFGPTATGSPVSYAISPSLPGGLSINSGTGIISGIPTGSSAQTSYTITATYAGTVTATASISITVSTPTISYSGSPFTFNAGNAISSLSVTATGSPVGYAVSPILPAGLSLNTTTGTISGTPTTGSAATSYTITASYAGSVTATATISITVLNYTIAYINSPFNFITGFTIPSQTPVTTGATPSSYSISTSLPAGLSFNTSSGVISGTATATSTSNSYTITANYSNGLSASCTIAIACGKRYNWTGSTSSNWSVAGNWDLNAVPGIYDLAYINGGSGYTGSDPTITANTTISEIHFGTGSAKTPVLTVNTGVTLNVTDTLMVHSGATVTLAGTGAINLAPGSSLSIINVGTGSSTKLTISANTVVTLQSDATGSAMVPAIPNGSSIVGTVNVQRYITGGQLAYRGYRLMSSPVYNATVSSNNIYNISFLTSGSFVTGAGSGFSKTGNPSVYLYNESITPSNATFISGNWQGISNINTTPANSYFTNNGNTAYYIPVGNGVLFFFRGVTGTSNPYLTTTVPNAGVLTMTGTLNQGPITVKDWYTPSSGNLAYTGTSTSPSTSNFLVRGFNCVGNPYASTIDLETFSATNSSAGIYAKNISQFIYELNPTSHNFDTYEVGQSGTVSTGNATRYIASGQGFFVQATGTSPALTFNEAAKAGYQNIGNNLYMATKNNIAGLSNTNTNQLLSLEMGLDAENTNEILFKFKSNASAAFNSNEDAIYMVGSGKVSIASVSADNIALGINTLPLPKTSETIALKVSATADGIYTITRKQLAGIPQLYDIWLMDNYKKDSLDIKHNTTYSFNIYKADTNSYGSKRFTLVIRQNPAYAYRLLSFSAQKNAAIRPQVQLTWTTENEQNYTNFTVERSNDGGNTYQIIGGVPATGAGKYSLADDQPLAGTNIYRLMQQDINNNITYSNIIPVAISNISNNLAKSNISIYPNPATNNVNLAFSTHALAAGNYQITISNSSGIVVKQANTIQNTWQSNINNLSPGTYLVRVIDTKDNALIGNAKFVKQ